MRAMSTGSGMMSKGLRASLVGGLLAAVTLGGCNCDPPPPGNDGGGTPVAQLALLTPLNGAVLTAVDDLDNTAAGIQTTVRVHVDPSRGVDVRLLVDDVEVASVEADGGRASFANITLTASAEGIEHTVTAEAEGYDSDTVTVTARVAEAVPSCQFLTPVSDTVDPPFDVTLTCLQAAANEPGTLRLLDADGAQVGPAYTDQLNGNLRFSVTSLDPEDGEYTLAFELDNFPATAIEKDITVSDAVVVPDPVCTIVSPTDGATVSSSIFDVTVECVDVPAGVTAATVTLEGSTTGVVSFPGTLTPTGGLMSAVVSVTAQEAGATVIGAEVTNYPASADSITVDVPALPACDAEILQPADGATDLFDVDLTADGSQIIVRAGAVGNPALCTGATVEVFVAGASVASGVLPGDSAQSGSATFLVTVPEGESTITAALTRNGVVGDNDSATITFTTPPVGIRIVGIDDCGGFGDGCFNLADLNQGAGAAYQRSLVVNAPAQNGACPFTDPLLDVEGLDQAVRADGDTDATVGDAWTFNNGICEATFTDVTLHADESPDGVLRALTLQVALVGGDAETRTFSLGLDRVSPALSWVTLDGARFGSGDDEDTNTAIIDALLEATVTGMDGRTVSVVPTDDLTDVLASCVSSGASAACAFTVTLADGEYDIGAIGTDLAGNALVADVRTIIVDSNGPCVASIAVDADSDQSGAINASEGGAAPVVTTVTVTFDTAACAVEDGQAATLLSTLGGQLGATTTTGNVATFSGASLVEGLHTLSVDVSDVAGNDVQAAGNAVALLVDVSAPTCTIASPTATTLAVANDEDGGANGLQVTFQLSTDGATARLLVDALEAATGTASGGTVTLSGVSLAEGQRSITAECSDAAGNTAISAAYEPIVDTVLPAAAFNNPPTELGAADDTDANKNGVQTSINVDVSLLEAGRTVALFLADAQGAPTGAALGTALTVSNTTAGGTETVAVPATFTHCVACSYVARVTDAALNTALSATTTITVTTDLYTCMFDNPDGTADPLPIGAVYDTDTDGDADVSFVVACPGLPAGSTAQLYVSGAVTGAPLVTGGETTLTFPAVELGVGTGTVRVLVEDSSGFTGGTDRRDYLVKLTAPVVAWQLPDPVRLTQNAPDAPDRGPLDTSSAAGYQAALSVEVTDCEGGTVLVESGATQVSTSSPSVGAGTVVVNLNVSIPNDAGQTLTVSCEDAAGNVGEDSLLADVDGDAPSTSTVELTWEEAVRGEIEVAFIEPGDDATTGDATVTILARKNAALTQDECVTQPTDVSIVPSTSAGGGAAQQILLEGLVFDVTWHFAICANDDAGNTSFGTASIDTNINELVLTAPDGVSGLYGYAINRYRGDINADGRDDLLVGAPSGAGAMDIVLGADVVDDIGRTLLLPPAGGVACATPDPSDGVCLLQNFGIIVHIVPSLNGDAYDDVLVVARDSRRTPKNDIVMLYAGGPAGIPAGAAPAVVLEAVDNVRTGAVTASLGDVDNDGLEDWGISTASENRAYLFLNTGAFPQSAVLVDDAADVTITNTGAGLHRAGYTISGVGDVDADGFDDMVVADFDEQRLYLLRGRVRADWPAVIDLAALPPEDVIAPYPAGAAPTSYTWDVSAGDLNGDGYQDLGVLAGDGLHVTLQNTDGTFPNTAMRFRATGGVRVWWGAGLIVDDLNSDGLDDMLVNGGTRVGLFLGKTTLVPLDDGEVTYAANQSGSSLVTVSAVNLIGGAGSLPDTVQAESLAPGRVVIRY